MTFGWMRLGVYAAIASTFTLGVGAGYVSWRDSQRKIGEQVATVRYEVALTAQKADAGAKLATVTATVRVREKALQDLKNTQELKDGEAQKLIVGLSSRLHGLAGPVGRLHDPSGKASGGRGSSGSAGSAVATSAGSGPGNPAEALGLLSADLTGLLLAQAKAADEINNAYVSCRADAVNVRKFTLEKTL